MLELVLAVGFTLLVSALCSTIEAMLLSTTVAEVEGLKARNPRAGALLEQCREGLEESISAILTLNTIANTFGSFLCGVLAGKLFANWEYGFAAGIAAGILVFGEILPKNVGVIYRVRLQAWLVYVLHAMRLVTRPLSWLMHPLIWLLLRGAPKSPDPVAEIAILAEKEAKDGNLTQQESKLISNTLKLDDVHIRDIMTPRIVVTALEKSRTIGEVFRQLSAIPFARLPVYEGNIDNIVGLARRRDLLKAKAADQDHTTVGDVMQPAVFVPETATAATALQQFLKSHQQIAVVVDEYGSMAGVVTMEDIFEHLLGMEIFEKDDLAVDMRELARRRLRPTPAPTPTISASPAPTAPVVPAAPTTPPEPAQKIG
jgi:CBS domain containing-hemolysin-like protein